MKQLIKLLFLFLSVQGFTQEVDLTTYLPKNYSKEAQEDYTVYLQKGINENRNVKMPNFPVLINKNGLIIPSNTTVNFQLNSKLKLIPSNTRVYNMLNLDNVENVIINNPNLEGERQESFNGVKRTGEWGMGIALRSCTNVEIYNANLNNFWGDGIYLGTSANQKNKTNQNIKIINAKIDKARRNGVSITTGQDVYIESAKIYNTGKKSPGAAIDIEANTNLNTINNIKICNTTTGYGRAGIIISLKKLVGVENKEVNILIENHIDEHSSQSFRFAGYNKEKIDKNFKPLSGEIKVKDATWKVGKGTFTYESPKNMFPMFIIDGLTIVRAKNGKEVYDTDYQFRLKTMLKKQSTMDVITRRKN